MVLQHSCISFCMEIWGPRMAPADCCVSLAKQGLIERAAPRQGELYGLLALTGTAHATDRAILLGLSGERPHTLCPDAADRTVQSIRAAGRIRLAGVHDIAFDEPGNLKFLQRERLPHHSSGLRFTAYRISSGYGHRVTLSLIIMGCRIFNKKK